MQYIHYGSTEFDIDKFRPISNQSDIINKPLYGFWASPKEANYGWKEWNEETNFSLCDIENSFCFNIKEGAKVIHIKDLCDIPTEFIVKVPTYSHIQRWYLDFEAMCKSGIDAIEIDAGTNNDLYYAFYGWDCDSICIMNPEIINCIKR